MIRSIQKALSPLYYVLFPQQSWLTEKYGRTWMDKDKIIFETLFGCVVHWVEVEGQADRETSYDEDLEAGYVSKEYVKNKQKIESTITDIYLWHTHDRNVMEKEIDALINNELDNMLEFNNKTGKFKGQKTYKKIKDLREALEKQDKEYMKQIVEICDHMWT